MILFQVLTECNDPPHLLSSFLLSIALMSAFAPLSGVVDFVESILEVLFQKKRPNAFQCRSDLTGEVICLNSTEKRTRKDP
jgi:hypothetical protein